MKELLDEQHWVAQTNMFGLWVVGPDMGDGIVNVLGMGKTPQEAFDMALRTKEKPRGNR